MSFDDKKRVPGNINRHEFENCAVGTSKLAGKATAAPLLCSMVIRALCSPAARVADANCQVNRHPPIMSEQRDQRVSQVVPRRRPR